MDAPRLVEILRTLHDHQVLGLERLLEVRRKLSRPKDKLMALQSEATLAERNKPKL